MQRFNCFVALTLRPTRLLSEAHDPAPSAAGNGLDGVQRSGVSAAEQAPHPKSGARAGGCRTLSTAPACDRQSALISCGCARSQPPGRCTQIGEEPIFRESIALSRIALIRVSNEAVRLIDVGLMASAHPRPSTTPPADGCSACWAARRACPWLDQNSIRNGVTRVLLGGFSQAEGSALGCALGEVTCTPPL